MDGQNLSTSDRFRNDYRGIVEDKEEDDVKVREYVNPAVYVETTYQRSGDRRPKIIKVKRCVCFSNPRECPCHPNEAEEEDDDAPGSAVTSSTTLVEKSGVVNFESDSGITVKETGTFSEDLHLSIPSLTSVSAAQLCCDERTREERYRSWLARKDEERRLLAEKRTLIDAIKKKHEEAKLEIERENFRRWLANKRRDEARRRDEELRREEEERTARELKEKRLRENELNYQLWLKKKEEMELEKKIKEQVTLMSKEEEKRRRTEYSAKAYDIWLRQSKSKPKPLPLNRGLQSLKSSVSVTYINPQPWIPNVDVKPASQ